MDQITNQFSFVLIGLGVVVVTFLLLRFVVRAKWQRTIIVEGVVIATFLVAFLVLRPGFSDVDDFEVALALINNDRPTFVEYFSNYCTNCLLVRPAVDVLVSDIRNDYNVMRINIHSEVGRQFRDAYGFSYTPEFILFDHEGNEVWRGHELPDEATLSIARAE